MIEEQDISEDADFGRYVKVTWVDSGLAVHPGWQTRADLPGNVATVESIGIWVGENDNVVALAGTRSGDAILNCQLIYKPCIISKEWLS